VIAVVSLRPGIFLDKMANPSVDITIEKRETSPAPVKPKKINKWLIAILGLIFSGGAGIAAVIFFAPWAVPDSLDFWGKKDSVKGQRETAKKSQGHIYNMEPFIANLADPNQSRYLKIRISLESKEIKVNEEYEKRLPQLRDMILTLLSSKSYKDISDSEGKNRLREEITSRLNQLLSSFQVKAVYFTEFMIQ
jgi:flagellar FliL protein